MRKPSRFMPPAPRAPRWLGYLVLALLGVVVVVLLGTHPVATLVTASILALLVVVGGKWSRANLAKMAASRPVDGGICAFARSFNLRHVDPWIVRATYEELQQYFEGTGFQISIRADDNIVRDLQIDPEDLEASVLDIAHRSRRSLDGYEGNPYYSNMATVRGVIMFLNAQPRVA